MPRSPMPPMACSHAAPSRNGQAVGTATRITHLGRRSRAATTSRRAPATFSRSSCCPSTNCRRPVPDSGGRERTSGESGNGDRCEELAEVVEFSATTSSTSLEGVKVRPLIAMSDRWARAFEGRFRWRRDVRMPAAAPRVLPAARERGAADTPQYERASHATSGWIRMAGKRSSAVFPRGRETRIDQSTQRDGGREALRRDAHLEPVPSRCCGGPGSASAALRAGISKSVIASSRRVGPPAGGDWHTPQIQLTRVAHRCT
jgi:hypothetical protein